MNSHRTYDLPGPRFKNLDKLIHHANLDGRVNVFYSTPAAYTAAKHAYNISWPLKTDDFFPYADCPTCYWTGALQARLGQSLRGVTDCTVRFAGSLLRNWHVAHSIYGIICMGTSMQGTFAHHAC